MQVGVPSCRDWGGSCGPAPLHTPQDMGGFGEGRGTPSAPYSGLTEPGQPGRGQWGGDSSSLSPRVAMNPHTQLDALFFFPP